MNLALTVLEIVAPVFLLAAIGFVWVKVGLEYRIQFVTRLAMTMGVPCLIFVSLMQTQIDPAALTALSAATVMAYGGVTLACLLLVHVLRLERRTYAAPLIFGNTGNLGLPLALFAFGEVGFSYAIIVFAIMAIWSFTYGISLVAGSGALTKVLREPLVWAVLKGGVAVERDPLPLSVWEETCTWRKAAVDQLAGEGRAYLHDFFGWWPILFPGFPGPGGWHVDGSNFHHRLQSKGQALVTLYLFSDIEPGDGGTALACGSHHDVARLLCDAEPEGLSIEALTKSLPEVESGRVVEVTGSAGDIAFLHPFLVHGFSANRGQSVRFACNPQYPFKEEMNLMRRDGDHSPVEEAIRVGLGWSA